MKLLDLALDSPEENLALDEALLESAEANGRPSEVLRLWESPQHVVVLGRSSNAETEVDLDACRRRGIPVLRRTSGGTTVVIGPGCLMYAVVLSYQRRPQLRMIEAAHQFVLERLRQAIAPQVLGIDSAGTSDLVLNRKKCSGNSLRCRQHHLLYHGTVVYDFSTRLMAECLGTPARQPEYRAGRRHEDFVANIPVDPDLLRRQLAKVWEATAPLSDPPLDRMREIIATRYAQSKWRISTG